MEILIGIAILLCIVFIPVVRCAVCNPHFVAYYGATDLFHYIKEKRFNNAPIGEFICYCGLFGRGKTLSCVHDVCRLYRRYNDKLVFRHGKFIPNKVFIFSNVTLNNTPYLPLVSLQEIVDYAHKLKDDGEKMGFNPIIYVLGDEFSVQMNSRNFKTNIDPLFLNVLLTCRHYNLSFYVTSQRFNHMDALCRQICQDVYEVHKYWRFQVMKCYDAWELENCMNPTLLKARRVRCWFIRNKDFEEYDTRACVGQLEKSVKEGDMLSEEEILSRMNPVVPDINNVNHFSFIGKRRFKK